MLAAVLIGACSSKTRPDRGAADATLPASDAALDVSVPPPPIVDAGAEREEPRSRPLPAIERLASALRKAKAHGFVAMTRTDARERTSAPIVASDKLDLDRPVLVASFTKLMTAVAALRMVKRKEISLDETVADVLPDLASRPWAKSTLRELLQHVSLVPEFDERGGFYRSAEVDFTSPVAVLSKNVPRAWTEKRGTYKYRNAELALVGAMLEARAKTSADKVLAKEVFEPAKMTHSGLLVHQKVPDLDLAPMGPIRPQNFFTAGAGYASANDLLSFFEALENGELLDKEEKDLLFDGAKERGYGALGCWSYPFAALDGGTTRVVERPGSFGNVRLFTLFFPEEHRAAVAWTGDGIDIPRPRTKSDGLGAVLVRLALD